MVNIKHKETTSEHHAHETPQQHMRHADPAAPWKVGCLLLSVLLVISVLTQGFGFGGSSGSAQQVVPTQVPSGNTAPQPQVKAELKEDGDPATGDKSAPVVIYEYSDFQCPFCERAFQQTYPEIKKLITEGKVRFVFKDYPLPFHEQADEAAIAANCVNKQGKYWEMHDKLFQTQAAWSGNPSPYTIFRGYAEEVGADGDEFDKCVTDPAVAKEVQDDMAEGSANGVSGTPTFYINGQQLVGAQPWTAFQQLINQELSK